MISIIKFSVQFFLSEHSNLASVNCNKKHYHIPDSKLVYRWPGACQMRCTWWWGRTCRPPDRAGPWPVWPAVSHDIKLKSTNWRRHHLHIETDSSERGQCSQSASMAVRGMVRAARRSDTAKLIIRMFLQDWENKQVEPALKVVDGKLLWEERTEHIIIILDHLKLIIGSFCHNSINPIIMNSEIQFFLLICVAGYLERWTGHLIILK